MGETQYGFIVVNGMGYICAQILLILYLIGSVKIFCDIMLTFPDHFG